MLTNGITPEATTLETKRSLVAACAQQAREVGPEAEAAFKALCLEAAQARNDLHLPALLRQAAVTTH